ncbi:uncharacterized protein LOC127752077 [Frankliniella occidentalis]|uniref:Uncharacterized protein LOC127752077 n=1 Tax=Frankliniella occidentalis TaxID=133901 RepID=A0A9C6XVL8_FRAOC|nr:uncharacterized protein LOC127752077 [Frankliniella occidentalis]
MLTRKLYDVVGEWVLNVEQSDEEKRMNKPPSALKPEDLNELEEQLSSTCAVSQVAINQGGYYDPMKNIKYYPKHGRKGSYSDPPLIKIDLPYYKVYVFKKEKDDNNSTEVIKQIVKNFLELKRVYREETSTASTSQKRPRSPDPDLPRRTSLPHGAGPSHGV